ncbi:hypothetical protein CRG98_014848 [Punica granatum]|uniref:Uncharacterized protein n=1 Tax=Punica granatum TaxID=22663 RepID=A0A2I0K8B6_PUNGR|nr:hypothetical protein CRG98_014848 [Punica granatum]
MPVRAPDAPARMLTSSRAPPVCSRTPSRAPILAQTCILCTRASFQAFNRVTRLSNTSLTLSSYPEASAFGSRGLGVSTFLWGHVTDTRERRSRHLSFYDPKVEGGEVTWV